MKKSLVFAPIILQIICLFIWRDHSADAIYLVFCGILPIFLTLICWGLAAILDQFEIKK